MADEFPDTGLPAPIPLKLRADGTVRRGMARDREAARLAALGWSPEDISDRLSLAGPAAAVAGIRRALAELSRFARDDERIIEARSYKEIERRLWQFLDQRHVLVSHGKIIYDETGEPLDDDRLVLETLDRIVSVKTQYAKLMGLNAPTRTEVVSIDSVEAEIMRLEVELGAAGAA